MAFEVHKQGKLADQLEERAYEWCAYQIEETFGVKRTKNEWDFEEPIENLLREDHIREIEDYLESDGIPWIEGYVRAALRGIVERWYESMEANET